MLTKYDSSASIPHLSSQDSGSNSNKDQVRIGYMSSFFKDTVIPIIAETNRSTKNNNIIRTIAFSFLIFQLVFGSFFFQIGNSKVPQSLQIISQIIFLGFSGGIVESELRFLLFAYLLFSFISFSIICIYYKVTREHKKWFLLFLRAWHCEIFNIFIIPSMLYTTNSLVYYGKYPTVNNAIFAFFHVFLAIYGWFNVRHITEILENNMYVQATYIFVWRTRPLYDTIFLYSIPFSLSPISSIFTNWAKILPEITLILICPLAFLSLYRKPYEFPTLNATCVSIPLFSLFTSILSIVNNFVGDKLSIYVYYLVPIIVLIVSHGVCTFILQRQINRIVKVLKTDSDLSDNDKIELFDSLKLKRIDFFYALQLGVQNRCNLFLDWSLPHYLVNNCNENTDLLIFATWLISFFPSETKTLNSFLVKISRVPALEFHQQCMFYQLHRIYVFRESSSSAEAANDFKPVFEQSEKCVAYISNFWKLAATFPEDIHNKVFEEMAKARRQSENMWNEILEKYPNNAQMMQEYSRFLANGQSKFNEAIRCHQKAILMETGQRIRNDKAFRSFLLKFPNYLKKGYVDNTGRLLKKSQRIKRRKKIFDSKSFGGNNKILTSYIIGDAESNNNNSNLANNNSNLANNNSNEKKIRASESAGNVSISTSGTGFGISDGSTIDSNTSTSSFMNGKTIDIEEARTFLGMMELRTAMERSVALFTTPIVNRIKIASILRLILTVGLCAIVWGITIYTFPTQKILFSHLVLFDKLSQSVSLITNQLNWFWITAYPDIPDDYGIFVQHGFDVNDDTFVNMKGSINLTIYNITRVALGQLDEFANDMYTSETNSYLSMFSEHYSKFLVNNSICADSKNSDFVINDQYSITVDYILRSYLTLITKMMNDKDFKRQNWDTKDNFCEGFVQSYVLQASFENLLKSISPSVDEVDPEDNTFNTYKQGNSLIKKLSYDSSRILDMTHKFNRESFINDMKKVVDEENERIMKIGDDDNNDGFVNLTQKIIGMPGKFKRLQEESKRKNNASSKGPLVQLKNVILPSEKKNIFYKIFNKIFNITIFSQKNENNNNSKNNIINNTNKNKKTNLKKTEKVIGNENPNNYNNYNQKMRNRIKKNNNRNSKTIIIGEDGELTFTPYDKTEDRSFDYSEQSDDTSSLNFLVGFTPFFVTFFALPSLIYLASALQREKQKLKELLLRTNENEAISASDVVTGHCSTASVHMSSVESDSYTWLWNAFSVLIVCICLVLIIVMGITKEGKQSVFVQHFIFSILQRNAVCDIARDLVYNAFHYQMETYGIRIHSFDPEKNKTKKGILKETAFSSYKMTKERLEYDFAYYDRISNLIQTGSEYVVPTLGFDSKVDQIRSQVNDLNSYDYLSNGQILTTKCVISSVVNFKECISFDRLLTYFIGQSKLIYQTPSLYNVTDEAIVELVYLVFTKITAEYDKLNKVYNESFSQMVTSYDISCLILFILSLICTFGSFFVELMLLNKFLGELDVIRSLMLRLNPLYFVSNPEFLATVYKRGKTDSYVTSSSHAMFQTSNDSLILVNAELIIENVNPAATRIFGYTPEQMLGQTIKFIIPQDLNTNLYYVVDLMSSGATSLNYENDATGNRDDGSEIPLRLSLVGFTSMKSSDQNINESFNNNSHNNNTSNVFNNNNNNNNNSELNNNKLNNNKLSNNRSNKNKLSTNIFNINKFNNKLNGINVNKKLQSIDMNNINGSKQAVGFAFILRDMTEEQRQKMLVEDAKKQAELILLQILPKDIIMRLNRGDKDITFTVDSATIIFIDIEKFSLYSSSLSAKDIMLNLSKIFTAFDKICNTFNLITKIKMIGDDYMAAAGLFQTDVNPQQHAVQVLQFAMQCLEALDEQNVLLNASLQVRIGINTDGPLIAGILGTEKPLFDIIGDPINVAARLQSTDIAGLIQISEGTYKLVADLDYKIEERGEIELKGKGKRRTYLVYPEESTEQAKQFLASDIDSAISTAVLQQIVNHDSSSFKFNVKSNIIGVSSNILASKK